MAMTEAEIDALLSEPMISILGTVDAKGRPAQAPVWHAWRDGAALILTDRASRKWRNIEANPNVSLVVDTKTPPYRAVILEGAAEAYDTDYVALLREVAIHYLGERRGHAYADASTATPESGVVVRIVPRRTISWAY
jgi:PPOX class probable F420-dependent enzyme